jgi:ribosome-associated protein
MIKKREITLPIRELNFTFSRSSGKGGQNVNKVNSKVTLKWNIARSTACSKDLKERFQKKYRNKISSDGMVTISGQRFRDQGRNVADCIERLHKMINSVQLTPKKRVPTKPTKSSIEKRLHSKRATKKIDY